MTDASPFTIVVGREALCCDHLNLAYNQVYASINPNCSCPAGAARRHQIGLLWERLSQLVDLGLLFSAVACKWHPGTRTQCGQSPLHHSICLPKKYTGYGSKSFHILSCAVVHVVMWSGFRDTLKNCNTDNQVNYFASPVFVSWALKLYTISLFFPEFMQSVLKLFTIGARITANVCFQGCCDQTIIYLWQWRR